MRPLKDQKAKLIEYENIGARKQIMHEAAVPLYTRRPHQHHGKITLSIPAFIFTLPSSEEPQAAFANGASNGKRKKGSSGKLIM